MKVQLRDSWGILYKVAINHLHEAFPLSGPQGQPGFGLLLRVWCVSELQCRDLVTLNMTLHSGIPEWICSAFTMSSSFYILVSQSLAEKSFCPIQT